jgi:hypothetical protein
LTNEINKDEYAEVSVSITAESPFKRFFNEQDILTTFSSFSRGNKGNHAVINGKSNNLLDGMNSLSFSYKMEDNAFILSGWIKSRKDNSPLPLEKLALSAVDSIAPRILYSRTDSLGKFVFYLNRYFDNEKLNLQLCGQSKNKDYYWELDHKTVELNHGNSIPFLLQPEEKTFLNTIKNLRLIDAVYSDAERKNQISPEPGGLNYFSPPDMVIIPRDYSDLVNFKEIVDNIVPVVKFAMRNNEYILQVLQLKFSIWTESNTVLLNGVPFSYLAYIATLGTKDIKRIEVICSNFLLGDLTFPGLVSIYTNDNKIPELYLRKNAVTYLNRVISNNGEEATDSIKHTSITGDPFPDFRNNLYWNPRITLNSKEKTHLEFPVSMLTGKYTIKVEGMTRKGIPVCNTSYFEVKE